MIIEGKDAKWFLEFCDENVTKYLFGAGQQAVNCLFLLKLLRKGIDGIVVTNPKATELEGVPIYSLDDVKDADKSVILLAIGSSASGELAKILQEKGFGKIYLCEDWEIANDAVKEQVFCDYMLEKGIDLSGEYIGLANHKLLNPMKHQRVYRQMLMGTFFSEIIVPGMFNDNKYGNLGHLDEIKREINGAKCVLDIGACAGLFSVMVSDIVEDVWAFEPSEAIRPYLMRNAEFCGNVHAESFGILDEKGERPFYDVSDYPKYSGFVERDGIISYKAKITTVDDWCEGMEIKPDVIRIDATDCLSEIMDGAKNTIKKYDPEIIIGTKIVDLEEIQNDSL